MLNEAIIGEKLREYSKIAKKEIKGEMPVKPKIENHVILDFLNPESPTFATLDPNDTNYVKTFRLPRWAPEKIVRINRTNSPWYNAGKDSGRLAVENGLIKSLDNLLLNFVVNQKIVVVEFIKESNNKPRIHVHECISCSGTSNIGRKIYLISGVLEKVVGKNRVIETHCCGLVIGFVDLR